MALVQRCQGYFSSIFRGALWELANYGVLKVLVGNAELRGCYSHPFLVLWCPCFRCCSVVAHLRCSGLFGRCGVWTKTVCSVAGEVVVLAFFLSGVV